MAEREGVQHHQGGVRIFEAYNNTLSVKRVLVVLDGMKYAHLLKIGGDFSGLKPASIITACSLDFPF